MKIRNVIHKGLRRFIEDDDASGLPAAIPKVRKIVSFLQDMETKRAAVACQAGKRISLPATAKAHGACS